MCLRPCHILHRTGRHDPGRGGQYRDCNGLADPASNTIIGTCRLRILPDLTCTDQGCWQAATEEENGWPYCPAHAAEFRRATRTRSGKSGTWAEVNLCRSPASACRNAGQREECPLYECCAAVGKPAQLGDLIQRWKEQADTP